MSKFGIEIVNGHPQLFVEREGQRRWTLDLSTVADCASRHYDGFGEVTVSPTDTYVPACGDDYHNHEFSVGLVLVGELAPTDANIQSTAEDGTTIAFASLWRVEFCGRGRESRANGHTWKFHTSTTTPTAKPARQAVSA